MIDLVYGVEMEYFCTTCSPSGKLVQIEYALAAVAAGAPSVGIKGKSVCCLLHKYTSWEVGNARLGWGLARFALHSIVSAAGRIPH